MIRFIENIGEYYSQHFFSDDFPKKVFDKAGYVTQKKDADGDKTANHLSEINARISPLREKYYRFKNDLLSIQREKDKVKRTHDFHREVLLALGYINGTSEYSSPVFLNDTEVIPVRYQYSKGGKPYLFVMEMKAIVREGDQEPPGIYDQTWIKEEWEKVFPKTWGNYILKPDIIKDALSELFLVPEDERPVYVILLAGAKIFLVHYEKWKYDSFLLFDLEELFVESQVPTNRDYLSLFYALLAKSNFLGATDSLLHSLDEDAHKAAYGVTQNLKKGVIYAVESLANEAIWFKFTNAKTVPEREAIELLMAEEKFARELKDECLTMVYRLLFLFYAEAREDLEILPVKDTVYQKGYSLEMLRDLEMVSLLNDSSRNGYFFSKSLWKLFDYLHNGVKTNNGFEMKPLDSPLFDNQELRHLSGVEFRNIILQQIIKRLSLSDQSKSKRIGRISYANLGINQLGSVYESLLAYSGFFAAETLIEVKAADDPDGKEGTFLVPLARRDDFTEEEILKDPDNPLYDKQIPKGQFVYRLNGRDRKKSASYYTPEVLTQTTVKYTLKGILDKLKERQEKGEDCADEILALKILEPAMGAAAFHNEVINQLADAYLELKENEEVRKGRKRIVPGQYNDELQKVKAFIAANNVYGVDLNPTAVELGKLSLWLNCMHRNMETPFFAHRLGTGNAVVGCWLKTYAEEDILVEYPTEGTTKQRQTPIPKAWWTKEPKRVKWDSKGNLTRKPNEYFHFLLPDDNMLASANIKLIKDELTAAQKNAVNKWKKEMKQPLTRDECRRLSKICAVIDALLEEHYQQIKSIIKETTSTYLVYGQQAPQIAMKGYDEKELLAESRNARTAPFYKLRMIMDYWCSLWFWDARKIEDLPTRTQWYNEIENILGVDLSGIQENTTVKEITDNIKKKSGDASILFGNRNRLEAVELLREQHKYFHHELEFFEVFKEKGGFDVIVGNPPWLKLVFEEQVIIGEFDPKIILDGSKASEIDGTKYLSNSRIKEILSNENIEIDSLGEFLGAFQNYSSLNGQQADLFKSILLNSLFLLNNYGSAGLIHPQTVFEDSKGDALRKLLYQRLDYLFQFRNELTLFPIGHSRQFSLCIYNGKNNDSANFKAIFNVFHPSTINACFNGNAASLEIPGIKYYNPKEAKYTWDLSGHPKRIISFNNETLETLSLIEGGSKTKFKTPKFLALHTQNDLNALNSLFNTKKRVNQLKDYDITEGWHETNDVKKGFILDLSNSTIETDSLDYYVFVSPQLHICNPFYRTPKAKCRNQHEYENYNLSINKFKLPRTKFKLSEKGKNVISNTWVSHYKLAYNKMLDSGVERTIQPSLLPIKSLHTGSIISIGTKDLDSLIKLAALCSSIIFDFYIKCSKKANVSSGLIESFPIFTISDGFILDSLKCHILRLSCLNESYSLLWEANYSECFKKLSWSKEDHRLRNNYLYLEKTYSKAAIYSTEYERRQALIELDVIVALILNLDFQTLISIYKTYFPITQQYEVDTWYDQEGKIVFTNNSQGLKGIGLDRITWDKITIEVNSMQRTLKDRDVYEHIISKSELYNECKIVYYPPFDKCDRVQDYKVAWTHFEKVFDVQNTSNQNSN